MVLNKIYFDILLLLNKIDSIMIITPFVFLALLSIFFFIPINIGKLGVRVDDIFILLCILILILHAKYVVVEKNIFSILLFLFSLVISMIYGYLIMDIPFNGGDINEFIRYCKILLFALLLGYILVTKQLDMTFKIFYYGSFYIILVGYLQLVIGKYLSLLYTSESQINTFSLFSYVFIYVQSLFEGKNNSILVSLENAQLSYQAFLSSSIFGYGIAKSYFVDITIDSEWFFLINRFGLVVVITSISLLFYLFFLKKQIENISNINLKYFILHFYLVVSWVV